MIKPNLFNIIYFSAFSGFKLLYVTYIIISSSGNIELQNPLSLRPPDEYYSFYVQQLLQGTANHRLMRPASYMIGHDNLLSCNLGSDEHLPQHRYNYSLQHCCNTNSFPRFHLNCILINYVSKFKTLQIMSISLYIKCIYIYMKHFKNLYKII